MLFRGVSDLPQPLAAQPDALLADMPRKVESVLRTNGLLKDGDKLITGRSGDAAAVGVRVGVGAGADVITIEDAQGVVRTIPRDEWPEDLRVKNVEALGFTLLRGHPGAIEIAGVILLMAMLGAVVLSRKQVQLDEEAKLAQARQLRLFKETAAEGVTGRSMT
jgi:hypothetical protein